MAISTSMRQKKSSTPLIATAWKSNASWSAGPTSGRKSYLCGNEYSIADIAIWPWYGAVYTGAVYNAAEFLDTCPTPMLGAGPGPGTETCCQTGRIVNRTWGPLANQLHERHDASDFTLRTQDKLVTASPIIRSLSPSNSIRKADPVRQGHRRPGSRTAETVHLSSGINFRCRRQRSEQYNT